MSLSKIDRHFCGRNIISGNYQLYFTLDNIDDSGPWIEGSVYRSSMRLYMHIYPGANPTGIQNDYDTHPNKITSRMVHLCDVVWDFDKCEWFGSSSLGDVSIKLSTVGYGWPVALDNGYVAPTISGQNPFLQRKLYGLLHCGGDGPMRLISSGAFNLVGASHNISRTAAIYDKDISSPSLPQNIGTYTLDYIIHRVVYTQFQATATFAGYDVEQVNEVTQYDRKTKAIINRVTTTTYLQFIPPPSDPNITKRKGSAIVGTYFNRRRYRSIPEQEWFHTSGSPNVTSANVTMLGTGVTGYESYEYSGDIVSAGNAVVDVSWGSSAPVSGSTFMSQLDYDWIIPSSIGSLPIIQPSVSKYVNVRRWVWKNLEVTHPRIKIRVITPNGNADSIWIGPTAAKIDPNNGLSGAGQAWPDDDYPPEYAGQGGTGRVPDLQVSGNLISLTDCFPDAGITPNTYLSFSPTGAIGALSLDSQNVDKLYPGYEFTVIDDSKAAGINFNPTILSDAEYIHANDFSYKKGWVDSSDPKLWRWPKIYNITLSGLTSTEYSWMNGTYKLRLFDPSILTKDINSSSFNLRYGNNYFGVPPGGVIRSYFAFIAGRPYFQLTKSPSPDPIGTCTTKGLYAVTLFNTAEWTPLKVCTFQLGLPANFGNVIPIAGTSITMEPIP